MSESSIAQQDDTAHPLQPNTDGEATQLGASGEIERLSKGKEIMLVLTLSMATFIAAIEQTIVSTAVPVIAQALNATEIEYAWIGTAYLLPVAASLPPIAKLSDIFGRKPLLTISLAFFLIGSLIGGLAIGMNMLLAGRVLQGIGGGGLLGLSATIIGDVFSPRERCKYYGILGIVWGVACGIGPVVGGALAEYVSWRWCMYINLPIGGMVGVFVLLYLEVHTPKTPIIEGLLAMDWLGTITIVAATVMFLLGLGYGGVAYPWNSAIVVCLIVFGLLTFGLFIIIEWKVAKYPLIPLRLFKSMSNVGAIGIGYFHGAVFMANLYYLPLYFQAVLGASPIMSGVYLLPVAVTLCVLSTVTGMYISSTGRYRPPMYIGLAMLVLGSGLYINLPPTYSWPRIILFQLISGLGLGPPFQAPIIAIFSLTKPADIASAAATFLFARDIATAMAVIFGGVIFQNRIIAQKGELEAVLSPEEASRYAGGEATSAIAHINDTPEFARIAIRKAFNNAIRIEWIFFTAMAAAALAMSFLISKQVLSTEHKIHKTGLEELDSKKYIAEPDEGTVV